MCTHTSGAPGSSQMLHASCSKAFDATATAAMTFGSHCPAQATLISGSTPSFLPTSIMTVDVVSSSSTVGAAGCSESGGSSCSSCQNPFIHFPSTAEASSPGPSTAGRNQKSGLMPNATYYKRNVYHKGNKAQATPSPTKFVNTVTPPSDKDNASPRRNGSNSGCRKRKYLAGEGGGARGNKTDTGVVSSSSSQWTKEEDQLLRLANEAIGTNNSKRISTDYMRRTLSDEQSERMVLQPGLAYDDWSSDEDESIITSIMTHGLRRWSQIAERLPPARTRTFKQCRDRWINCLDPAIKRGKEWSQVEDDILIEAQGLWGNSWVKISKLLPGRSGDAVKNRWRAVARRDEERGAPRIKTRYLTNLSEGFSKKSSWWESPSASLIMEARFSASVIVAEEGGSQVPDDAFDLDIVMISAETEDALSASRSGMASASPTPTPSSECSSLVGPTRATSDGSDVVHNAVATRTMGVPQCSFHQAVNRCEDSVVTSPGTSSPTNVGRNETAVSNKDDSTDLEQEKVYPSKSSSTETKQFDDRDESVSCASDHGDACRVSVDMTPIPIVQSGEGVDAQDHLEILIAQIGEGVDPQDHLEICSLLSSPSSAPEKKPTKKRKKLSTNRREYEAKETRMLFNDPLLTKREKELISRAYLVGQEVMAVEDLTSFEESSQLVPTEMIEKMKLIKARAVSANKREMQRRIKRLPPVLRGLRGFLFNESAAGDLDKSTANAGFSVHKVSSHMSKPAAAANPLTSPGIVMEDPLIPAFDTSKQTSAEFSSILCTSPCKQFVWSRN